MGLIRDKDRIAGLPFYNLRTDRSPLLPMKAIHKELLLRVVEHSHSSTDSQRRAVRQGPLQPKASNAAAMYEERNNDNLWERDVGMDCGELVEWARCRSMNPGRELASVLSRPGPWGLTTNKEA